MASAEIARVVRNGFVESTHHGHVVAVDARGDVIAASGDPDAVILARSSLKPLQVVAMCRSGLALTPPLLALAAASHSGESRHLEGVRAILGQAGLDEGALQNTPDLPYGETAHRQWWAGGLAPSSLAQNCSGKHAAMLATCVASGWDTATYRDPDHELQRRIRTVVTELSGEESQHTVVDGCGAPMITCTLSGLARAFGRIASSAAGTGEEPEAVVGRAIVAHPEMLGGTDRDVTTLIAQNHGLVAKDGAEGVYAVGLPDGRGIALKVLDGSNRCRPPVVAAALAALGAGNTDLQHWGHVAVLGHGREVGTIEPVLPGWS